MHRGECVTTGGLYRPTRLCVAHLNCTKMFTVFFFGVVRLEGVWWGGVVVCNTCKIGGKTRKTWLS